MEFQRIILKIRVIIFKKDRFERIFKKIQILFNGIHIEEKARSQFMAQNLVAMYSQMRMHTNSSYNHNVHSPTK